jgi:hypothetical protein
MEGCQNFQNTPFLKEKTKKNCKDLVVDQDLMEFAKIPYLNLEFFLKNGYFEKFDRI